jgi:RNase P subunit RPR2
MTRTAALASRVTHVVPVIDPRSLTRAQLAGRRCAVPNCGRLLAPPAYKVGRLPDGRPVLACPECGPAVRYERAEERIMKAA